ncbi:sensor histidine kinase [Pelagibacterium luteolum]|uniref:histidine kinase n=1 Tax=Pelagibacterium luteolum TaxID=440168 RepID=A0A1G8A399_9HYPH|nr:sensor histidine kinase [Pelagibacterium luteolum]SDH15341.1 His Kinase A (phospho-acceptor) domain-containing protein [Pelagibacterium luteolum]
MILTADLVIATAVAYVGLLFIIAYLGDRQTRTRTGGFLRSPFVYTLSISVYCTSWTFYGAVGTAARSGLEFLTIYLGPTIVFLGWWFILRRLVRISHDQRITSIADLLSSRFGKSSTLGVLITVLAVIAIAPYIALQLKAITSSIEAIAGSSEFGRGSLEGWDEVGLAFGVAAGMAIFTILFGTRNVDAKEQHHGVVAAIAFEAVVKLAALIAVGVFVVYMGGGMDSIFANAAAAGHEIHARDTFGDRWIAMTILAAAAVICLPRQFQVTVVENSDENHLRTASWAFPAYMLAMSLFTLPIALFGLSFMPEGSNPDMYVLTLPLAVGQDGLALFAFIGGFSSATSMIILESIALSIMVSNHIVVPVMLRLTSGTGIGDGQGVRRLILNARRISIILILFLGFGYFYLTRTSDALAPIGLISFTGVAQFLPAILASLFWRDASTKAAICAVLVGFVVWLWASFLPSFASSSPIVADIIANGPGGIGWLRPQELFGLNGLDPLTHAVFWSLFLNSTVLILGSLITNQSALEHVQAALFLNVFRRTRSEDSPIRGTATADDLFLVARRVLGHGRAVELFSEEAKLARMPWTTLEPSPAFIRRLERELAGSIGAASAHVMLSKVVSGDSVSLEEVMRMADETQQAIEYSQDLEKTSTELRATAEKLEEANRQLRKVDLQKDEFLSQVSHEVRTPMTAIRAFSEILLSESDLPRESREKFISTIHKESLRLTSLLDEILDLSALERGERAWENRPLDAEESLDQALRVCDALARQSKTKIVVESRAPSAYVKADPDRLSQVLINLITNAIKYNGAIAPEVTVRSRVRGKSYIIEVEDNGIGIAEDERGRIFDKFYRGRLGETGPYSGAGLGLPISREIIGRMDGKLDLVSSADEGACFRITLPLIAKPDAKAAQ